MPEEGGLGSVGEASERPKGSGRRRRVAILAGAKVTGVLGSSPRRSRQVAGEWRVPRAYGDLDEVLADDSVDAVHICTRTLDGARGSAVFDQENPETMWLGAPGRATTLFRDPTHGSDEQRRLSSLPAGHAQGYAQCFEAFVADTYAAIEGETPATACPPSRTDCARHGWLTPSSVLPATAHGPRCRCDSECSPHAFHSGHSSE